MIPPVSPVSRMTERVWLAATVTLSVAVVILTVWCLSQGITTVFMHLYYIPIVLLAYHYRKRGIVASVLLSVVYLVLVIIYDGDSPATVEGALIRAIVFVAIAALVAYLAENLVTARDRLKSVADIQQSLAQNTNVWLMVLDKTGRIHEWNHAAEEISGYPALEVVEKNTIWKFLYPDPGYRKEITGKITEIITQNRYLENLRTTITSKDGKKKTILWNTREIAGNTGAMPRYIAIGVDITERTRAETALQESEAKYHSLFENMLEGMAYCRMIYDEQGRPVDWVYLTVNRSFERLTGLAGVEGKRVLEVIPDIRTLTPEIFDTYGRVASTGNPETFEIDFKPLNTWMRISAFCPEKGHFVAVFDDITEHKHIEDEVRSARDFYLRILDDFPNPVWRAGVNAKCDYFNKSWLAFTGRTIGQELGDGWAEGVHPDDLDRCLKIYLDHFNARTPFEMEYRLRYHDGTYHWLLDFGKPFFTRDGEFSGYIGSCYDIQDRKMAEAALRESEEKYRTLIEKANEAIIIAQDGNFAFANPSMSKLLGVPADELTGKPFADFIWPDDRNLVTNRYRKRMAGEDIPDTYDFRVIGAEGKLRWVFISAAQIIWQGRPATLNLLTDITERKRVEEELALEKERMECLLSLNQKGQMADTEIISTVVEDAIRLTGSTIGYLATMNEDESVMTMRYWSKSAHESCKIVTKPIVYSLEKTGLWGEAVRQRKPIVTNDYAAENPLKRGTPAGHVPLVRHMNIPVFEGDRIVAVAGVGNKRTEYNEGDVRQLQLLMQGWWQIVVRRRTEEALRESEQKFRDIFNNANDGIEIVGLLDNGMPGRFADINDVTCRMLGYTREEMLRLGPLDIGTDYFSRPFDELMRELHTLGHATFETEHRRKDGTIVPVEVNTHKITLMGNTVLISIARDITERKRMEDQVRESRQLFSDIISFLPDPTFVIDKNGFVLAWNRALEHLSGVMAADILGKGNHEYSLWQYGKRRPILIDLVLNPDQDAARMNYLNIVHEGTTVTAETQLNLQSGKRIALSLVTSPLYDSKGAVVGAIESMRDITHIKETEAELSRFNANLENLVRERTRALEEEVIQRQKAEKDVLAALDYTRSVIESNPDMVVVLDHEGTVLDINTAGESLTGLPRDQLIGKPYFGFLDDDGTLYTAFSRLLETGTIENFVRIRRTDGHLTPLSVHATVLSSGNTSPGRIIVSAHDITRQKQDEAAIQASLDEKVLLLREIHHRVKNNLQIIISLTNLQMRTIDDPGIKQILAETRNRVRAMSLVHEKLYMSENLSSLDLADYTKFLASQLFSFYGVNHLRVTLHTDIEKIPLDIDTAIPLGLILNELISNALKHAFPNDRKGTVRITGHLAGEALMLTVSDDGAGFPPGSDWRATESLGLRLVTGLVDQLGGTIEKKDGAGTMFIITIHRKTNRGSRS